MSDIRLVVVDDHALFRAGLISLLDEMDGILVIGEAEDGQGAIQAIRQLQPDLVLLDVNMPGMSGVDVVREIKKDQEIRVLMLTISRSDDDLLRAISSGADGYLLKNAEPEELEKAIHLVNEGFSILSPEVTRKVLDSVNAEPKNQPETDLSKREMEVLVCLSSGQTTNQIAEDLFISENTVKTHVRHILEKLNASNRAEAVSKAIQFGLIGGKK